MPFRIFTTEKHHRQPSLFGEIIDWLLAPLLILWPVSMAVEYSLAYAVANTAYDRELKESVLVLSRQLVFEDGRLRLAIGGPAREILLSDDVSETFLQVRDANGQVVDGDPTIPGVEFTPDRRPQEVYFRDESVRSREVRTAFMYAQVRGMPGAALVQVAETDEKRAALASRIIEGLLAAQFVLLPLALVLVWSGLRQGMKPLNELTDAIRTRRWHDLSPLDPGLVPEELRPFIDSINGLMSRLEASLKLQQRFVADAAHQMRTPLAGLRTQAELALRQRDLESLQHNLRQIASGADRASRLISQLLSLARAEGDAPALEPVELNGLVQAASGSWVSLALERGIDLGFETAGRACWIDGNDVLLQELLNNLIDNALRYTERDGRVTTRIVAGDEVVLEVEDDGVGIEAAERELVFERFYRVLGTRSEGTGLGLAIVRGIAEAHHARIELLDRRGSRGTLMRITFPYRIAFDATSIAA